MAVQWRIKVSLMDNPHSRAEISVLAGDSIEHVNPIDPGESAVKHFFQLLLHDAQLKVETVGDGYVGVHYTQPVSLDQVSSHMQALARQAGLSAVIWLEVRSIDPL